MFVRVHCVLLCVVTGRCVFGCVCCWVAWCALLLMVRLLCVWSCVCGADGVALMVVFCPCVGCVYVCVCVVLCDVRVCLSVPVCVCVWCCCPELCGLVGLVVYVWLVAFVQCCVCGFWSLVDGCWLAVTVGHGLCVCGLVCGLVWRRALCVVRVFVVARLLQGLCGGFVLWLQCWCAVVALLRRCCDAV